MANIAHILILKGLECTSSGGGGGDMVYPVNTGLAYYNSATGTWGSSVDPSSFLPATGNAVSASALKMR